MVKNARRSVKMNTISNEDIEKIEYLISSLQHSEFYAQQIVHTHFFSPRDAIYAEPKHEVHPQLKAKLLKLGIRQFFAHQSLAFDIAKESHDFIIVTGTGSGKTLCFNLPVIDGLLSEPNAHAIYIYPTKSLAQDQLEKVRLLLPEGISANVYDGDTPLSTRSKIRKNSQIFLTNPDMLHVSILPNHAVWAKIFKSLRYIVLDELHAYSGIFGSHVAHVIYRLSRICEKYGSKPQFFSASATIRNSAELFKQLTSRDPIVINQDTSGSGWKCFILWNPPEFGEGERKSANWETAKIVFNLVKQNAKTLTFCQSRVSAEITRKYTEKNMEDYDKTYKKKIDSYRGGYTPEERRQIEQKLFSGELSALISTSAMELGVDVGHLDAVVINGFPGSISSLKQQSGRAGRGKKPGLAILILRNDPLEQFFARKPEILTKGAPEFVLIKPSNHYVLESQLLCAAHEIPISTQDLKHFPNESKKKIEELEHKHVLVKRSNLWFYPHTKSPASDINIRGIDKVFQVFCEGELLGTMEEWRAYQYAHIGAIYLHRGEQYIVKYLDTQDCIIETERTEVDYFTEPFLDVNVNVINILNSIEKSYYNIQLHQLKITSKVTEFAKRHIMNLHLIGTYPLDLPPLSFQTIGVSINLPQNKEEVLWNHGVHGFEHAMLSTAPLLVSCNPQDIGSAFYAHYHPDFKPKVFVFDSAPGGTGISEGLFELHEEWLKDAHESLTSCKCLEGCPACLLSPRCYKKNEGISKPLALKLFSLITEKLS